MSRKIELVSKFMTLTWLIGVWAERMEVHQPLVISTVNLYPMEGGQDQE